MAATGSRPTARLLAAERATLLEARRHLERGLRVLQAEEQALLRWAPGQPLPMPDPVAAVAEELSESEESEEEWLDDEAAAEPSYGGDQPRVEASRGASTGEEPRYRSSQLRADVRMEASRGVLTGVLVRVPVSGQPAASDAADDASSDWEDALEGELPEDSPWVSQSAPSVLGRTPALGGPGGTSGVCDFMGIVR